MSLTIDLTGRVVLVTGGGKGVGRGITDRFLEAGAEVVICGRSAPDDLPAAGGRTAVFLEADVRDVEQIDAVVTATTDRFGRLDTLVNNAGGAPFVDAATVSPRFTEKIIALNLLAPINFAQRANAVMQNQDDGGSIVNIASVSGQRPSPGTTAYGAAKAGLLSATQSLAVEWAPKVRLNAIAAGLVRTEQAHLHYGDDEGIARVSATVPLGRMAIPTDVGDACVFLASPMASYVSGASLQLHGGGEPPPFLDAAKNTSGG
ncbi:MAG: SDR family oxidoreductase [Candidatus Binatia bacterium]|nr:SDR family oxidoreductase [Candidatus Binatia bacterium]